LYCYARYMKKFKEKPQDWGYFVDVKVNAPAVLTNQIKKIKNTCRHKPEVFMSSICDPWQPLEAKYGLSRACLKILLEAGFYVSILTKSSLIRQDFDLLEAYKTHNLGITITTLNPGLQKLLEPYASNPQERLSILEMASEKGIEIWVFLGPLIPEFSDTLANLEPIFMALKGLNLSKIYVDRLNPRWGVLESLRRGLSAYDFKRTRLLLYKCTNTSRYLEYSHKLRQNCLELAIKSGLLDKLTFCF
ncbi:MAG: hypothetical protein NC828_01580, partial [Candidatus Omnitrophica bacterium]|nr:hypothetical protein [Candidatus Omnitrophota bacterium]